MGGCAYYRCVLPALTMDKKFGTQSFLCEYPSEDDIKSMDILVQQRCAGNYLSNMEICKKNNIPFVFENDDDDFHIPVHNEISQIYGANKWIENEKKVIFEADAIFVSTKPLKEIFKKYTNEPNKIYVVYNSIDLTLSTWNLPKEEHSHIEIGYACGSSHYYDLSIIGGGVIPVREFPEPKVILSLAGYDIRIQSMETIVRDGKTLSLATLNESFKDNIWIKYLGFFQDAYSRGLMRIIPTKDLNSYPTHYTYFDIGVAPLEKAIFSDSKSNLKFIEFSAYRIPAVYSRVTPYSDTVEHGVDGFLADSSKEWTRYLNLLIEDEQLRKTMGENARKKLERDYDLTSVVEKRFNVFKELLETKCRK